MAAPTLNYYKFLFLTVNLIAALIMAPAAATRNARLLGSVSSTLEKRLKAADEGSSDCWESLSQLEACTGELIWFFLNGELNLGSHCCEAIANIGHHCWPTVLEILGLTTEEGNILLGYCDGEDDGANDRSHA
ncbi:egg cell-secreted protein 1.1 [Carica papaya]|uniref:egg cell-secreted protein 1.1 n=1 Tax=Carica papaya TaxID=3649 RepID=UPI000B8C9DC2|nr:egg cell-secreted protein 1.1 [Carica papaya]